MKSCKCDRPSVARGARKTAASGSVLGRLRETAAQHRPVTPSMLGCKPVPTSPKVLIFSIQLTLPSGNKGSLYCGVRRVDGPCEEVVFSSDALDGEEQTRSIETWNRAT